MFEIKEIKSIKAKDSKTGATLFEIDAPIKVGFEGNPCPECGTEMVQHGITYSSVNTSRAKFGQHAGDVYKCENCGQNYIDDFLTNTIHIWSY